MDNKTCVGYLTNIRDMFIIGSKNCECEALKYHQNFIDALNYAIELINGTECMEEDAKQASIPYTYNAPQHDWKCGYPELDYVHHDSITRSDTQI